MKKISIILSAALLAAMPLFAAKADKKSKTEKQNVTTIDASAISDVQFMKNPNIIVKDVVDRGEFYQVYAVSKPQFGSQPFDIFITKDKKYLFLGTGFSAKDGSKLFTPLSENDEKIKAQKAAEMAKANQMKQMEEGKARVDKLKDAEGKALFKIGSGNEKLYVFIDPECPFCKKLDENLEVLSNKYTIYVYSLPLWMHENAVGVTYLMLQQKNAEDRYAVLKRFSNPKSEQEVLKEVEEKGINQGALITAKALDIARKIDSGADVSKEDRNFLESWARAGGALNGYNVLKNALESGYFKTQKEQAEAKKTLKIFEEMQSTGMAAKVQELVAVAESVGVRGTPTVFDQNGVNFDWQREVSMLISAKDKK